MPGQAVVAYDSERLGTAGCRHARCLDSIQLAQAEFIIQQDHRA